MSRLRWPTPRELRVGIPILVPLLILGMFVVRGRDTGTFPHVRAPDGTASAAPPPPTAPVDLTAISIPGVDGTTTTAPVRTAGTARLSGVVSGPEGPIAGATVRLDRVAATTTTSEVTAGPDGRYDAPNVAGGRYRVRAFLAPTFAQTEPEIFFLADGEERTMNLTVESFTGLSVTSAVAPDPPTRDAPVTFVVRVAARSVDERGIVRAQPVPNATVTLTGTQGWSVSGAPSAATNGSGDAGFTLVCRAGGTNQVQIEVRQGPTDVPHPATLEVTPCEEAPATTSAPPSSGSSSSSSSASSGPN